MQTCAIKHHLFLGCLRTGELNMHLNQSGLWKDDMLLQKQSLIDGYFQDLHYIGVIHPFATLSFEELKDVEKKVRNQLQVYCPKLEVDKQTFYLFTQTYLT